MMKIDPPKMDLTGLLSTIQSLGDTPKSITLRIPPQQQKKLDMFTAQRDILRVTPGLQESVVRAMVDEASDAIDRGDRSAMMKAAESGGLELRRIYTDRFLSSGGDVPLKALSRAWAARKRRRGLDPRTGYATGALARAISQSTVVVR